jgi:hypothetical protein
MQLNNVKKIIVAILMFVLAITLLPSLVVADSSSCTKSCRDNNPDGISCGVGSCLVMNGYSYCDCENCGISQPGCCNGDCPVQEQ